MNYLLVGVSIEPCEHITIVLTTLLYVWRTFYYVMASQAGPVRVDVLKVGLKKMTSINFVKSKSNGDKSLEHCNLISFQQHFGINTMS